MRITRWPRQQHLAWTCLINYFVLKHLCRDWENHPAVQQYTFIKRLGEVSGGVTAEQPAYIYQRTADDHLLRGDDVLWKVVPIAGHK